MSTPERINRGTSPDCFHCDRSGAAALCKLWRTTVCGACQALYHRPYHDSCETLPSMIQSDLERRSRGYTLCLTSLEGHRLNVKCRVGQKIRMQAHVEGTYLYSTFGMTLVAEDRGAINEMIARALHEIIRPANEN